MKNMFLLLAKLDCSKYIQLNIAALVHRLDGLPDKNLNHWDWQKEDTRGTPPCGCTFAATPRASSFTNTLPLSKRFPQILFKSLLSVAASSVTEVREKARRLPPASTSLQPELFLLALHLQAHLTSVVSNDLRRGGSVRTNAPLWLAAKSAISKLHGFFCDSFMMKLDVKAKKEKKRVCVCARARARGRKRDTLLFWAFCLQPIKGGISPCDSKRHKTNNSAPPIMVP